MCHRYDVSEAIFYKWKAKYGRVEVSEARRLKALEDENARLKKLLAESVLNEAALRELPEKKNGRKREAVAHLREIFATSERRARRKAIGTRAPILVTARPNARWSLDFVHDQLDNGRRFRVLNIVDDVTRECLAAVPDTSISGARVVRELTALMVQHGRPAMIVSDNGTELTADVVLK